MSMMMSQLLVMTDFVLVFEVVHLQHTKIQEFYLLYYA